MAKRIVRTLTTLETGYLSVPEVAKHLHVCHRQVRKWITAGALPAIRIGHLWRVSIVDVRMFIAASVYNPGAICEVNQRPKAR